LHYQYRRIVIAIACECWARTRYARISLSSNLLSATAYESVPYIYSIIGSLVDLVMPGGVFLRLARDDGIGREISPITIGIMRRDAATLITSPIPSSS
jgi:hypothetical protein